MGNPTPKYLLVEKYIKDAIAERTIAGKLPGERSLAKSLGISYMTVRKAIERLVDEGVLFKVPTKGTFVADSKTRTKAKTRLIGYFLDSAIVAGISSPYYSLIFNTVEKVAARNGYAVSYFSDITQGKLVSTLARLDGVVATCFPRIEHVIEDIRQRVPVVVIDNASADKTVPSVVIDNFNADLESVNYLHSLGHVRIGFMTGLEDSDVGKNRFAGYRTGLSRNAIPYDDGLIFKGDYSFESGVQGADYFLRLDKRPTAIVCSNDSMALGAIRRFHSAGLNVPKDISLVGFDDIEVASQIVPALTTVAAPVDGIAENAFRILQTLIQGGEPPERHVVLPARMIIRQSCAEPARSVA